MSNGLTSSISLGATLIILSGAVSCDSSEVSATNTPVPVDHLTVTPPAASITIGASQPFAVAMFDANDAVLTGRAASWASSNPSVATVSSSGVATGVTAGIAAISATAEGKTGTAIASVLGAAASCNMVGGTSPVKTTSLAKPGYLQSTVDPDFGTTITRISGDPGTAIPTVGGAWETSVRADYPKDAVWNADQSLLLLKHANNPRGSYLFLDGSTYQVQFGRRGSGGVDERWHPTMPDVMVAVFSDGSVAHWNVRTNTSTWKYRPTGYSGASFGDYEGNPSRDGRYLAVQATRVSDRHLVAFAVDVDAGTKFADIDLTAANVSALDWASVSATGNYVVVFGTIDGRSQRTKVFTRAGAEVGYWTNYQFGHFDLGFDVDGNEIAFGGVGGAPNARQFIARRLDNAAVSLLSVPTTFDWHSSMRDIARPNWGYAVTNNSEGSPYDGEIYAVKLDGSGVNGAGIERFAHHRSRITDYEASPMPVPSPDGRRVLFNSNWGDPSGRPMQAYVADTRKLCPNGLPQ